LNVLYPTDTRDAEFREANLRNAVVEGNAERVDFRRADLRGANLQRLQSFDIQRFRGAIYDAQTRWPNGFDISRAAVVRGDLYSVPPPSWFTGTWVIKPTDGGAGEPRVLEIEPGTHAFKWETSTGETVGKWRTPPKGAKTRAGSLLLTNGEAGLDFIITQDSGDPELCRVVSLDGRLVRTGRKVVLPSN
jgi:hypothetical protein